MNWNHVHLIYLRELRDQLRDRRTMFTIAILPLLLYPLMGMLMLQIAQLNRVQPVSVAVVGYENWPKTQPLIDGNQIAAGLAPTKEIELIEIERTGFDVSLSDDEQTQKAAKKWLNEQEADLVVIIPPNFDDSLIHLSSIANTNQTKARTLSTTTSKDADSLEGAATPDPSLPASQSAGNATSLIKIYRNQINDQSQVAYDKIQAILRNWQDRWVDQQLNAANLPPQIIHPVQIEESDIAPVATRQALIWSKLMPFVMLVWALTGAFYPAIDLCAGEKERGTLETLLSSPTQRREIVWGKLLTVMTFSVGTALLNLISMQFTASFIMKQFQRLGADQMIDALGPLPMNALGWLFIMLIPISALFSALALAVAALARSSKEGQYYLMPLLLIGLPLVMLPMMPGVTLSLGTSIIPVTGAVLLSRSMIEQHYHDALVYAPFVFAVTIGCCLLAVRWAVRQFDSESVLFRENERFVFSHWLKRMWQDRAATASANEAILCGLFILVTLFFGRLAVGGSSIDWKSLVVSTVVIQLALILGPCLIMAIFLTRSLRQAFRLNRVRIADIAVSFLLAVCLHPTYVSLAEFVHSEYSIGADTQAAMAQMDLMLSGVPLLSVIYILAVIPAICEELAFRGFVFGGLMKQNGVLRAILLSSVFFGLSHGVLQQSITASLMGLVLGLLAWRCGSVICGIVFHMTHNAISVWVTRVARSEEATPGFLNWAFDWSGETWAYSPAWCTFSLLLSIVGITWFFVRSPFDRRKTPRPSLALQKINTQ